VKRLEAAVEAVEPGRGSAVDTAQLRYYTARDCLRRIHAMRLRLAGPAQPARGARAPPARPRPPGLCIVREPHSEAWLDVLHADDPGARLEAIAADVAARVAPVAARQEAERDALLLDLLGEVAWLAVLLDAAREDERVTLAVTSPVGERAEAGTIVAAWTEALERENVLEVSVEGAQVTAVGWGARALLGREPGVDLLCAPKSVPVPLVVSEPGAEALPPVKRLRLPSGFVLDLSRGVAVLAGAGPREGSCLLRMGLPLPPEVR